MPLFAEVNVLWPNGLLNRYTVKSCIGGSNPPLSARSLLLQYFVGIRAFIWACIAFLFWCRIPKLQTFCKPPKPDLEVFYAR